MCALIVPVFAQAGSRFAAFAYVAAPRGGHRPGMTGGIAEAVVTDSAEDLPEGSAARRVPGGCLPRRQCQLVEDAGHVLSATLADTSGAPAMPALDRPSAIRAITSRSRGVRAATPREWRLERKSWPTTSGSSAVPPPATRASASANSVEVAREPETVTVRCPSVRRVHLGEDARVRHGVLRPGRLRPAAARSGSEPL